MLATIRTLVQTGPCDLKPRLIAIYTFLLVLNVGAWAWAVTAFQGHAGLLGIALAVYGLGLRHAVDADHIAAIDNVTRKLVQMRQTPVSVGFFFALGHSAVICIVAALVALAATTVDHFEAFKAVGGLISTSVSALFLFAVAAINIAVFVSVFKAYRRVRAGGAYVEADLDTFLSQRGFLARLLRPLFALVTRSWHMFPLGFLFGLGFDTATEVAMFGVSAAQAAKGLPLSAILVFPMLFAAGMSLVDTTDGVMMLGAYQWAFVKPIRKLFYNMTITLVSILVALAIGGIEALGLIADQIGAQGSVWRFVSLLDENFNNLGFGIIGLFAAAWALSHLIYKAKGFDKLDARSA